MGDFEQNGLSRLEPAREFVKSLNQAKKLLSAKNYPEMTTFLKNIGLYLGIRKIEIGVT